MVNPKQILRFFALASVLLGCSSTQSNPSTIPSKISQTTETSTYTVISVGDGDTLKARSQDGTSVTVRIGCIDAPETRQRFGPEASQRLKALLLRDSTIELREIDTDRYGRTVAEIFYPKGLPVGVILVNEGYAVVYRRYLDGCAATADLYLAAEDKARSQQLNFWSQPNPVMPWDFRRGQR
ncbi:MAG: thermonuclease family protein [Acaryochloris sp. RU_4_1]|nr:thermonuclease family protein [Acaryochloris sp. RU_4_1]NJR57137.1 thermonuclease family protein [Acaryochloris sp. CRU_2_0]